MSRLLAAAALVVPTLLAAPAAAQVAPPAVQGAHQHDGLFLRFQGGPAYLSMSDDDSSIYGTGFGLHLAIGGSPAENVVIFGEVVSQAVRNPTVDSGGSEKQAGSDASMSYSYLGPGIAYYFGDSNFFLSGSLGLTTVSLAEGGVSIDLGGYGGRVGLGKEWWVSDQWGLGVAADFLTSTVELEEAYLKTDRQTASSFAVTLSATFQ